jgi:hypothetical protein
MFLLWIQCASYFNTYLIYILIHASTLANIFYCVHKMTFSRHHVCRYVWCFSKRYHKNIISYDFLNLLFQPRWFNAEYLERGIISTPLYKYPSFFLVFEVWNFSTVTSFNICITNTLDKLYVCKINRPRLFFHETFGQIQV